VSAVIVKNIGWWIEFYLNSGIAMLSLKFRDAVMRRRYISASSKCWSRAMNDRAVTTVTSRERLRHQIAQEVEQFLRRGGSIEQVPGPTAANTRPVGTVWWDARGSMASH